MLDATILRYVKEHNASIGKQKIMNMIGFAFAPLLAGYLIDSYSRKKGYKSYLPAFIMSDVLMGVACLFAYKVKMTADKNKSNIFRDLGKLVTALEVDLFLLLVLVLGCNFGFIETYLFIYLQSLGAPTFLLGLTMTVGCLSSIPMLFCADWIDKKIGRHKIFATCFTAYAIRMIGYSFIRNPWMCLIFECFEAITYQLMWVTCLKLCPLLAPKGLKEMAEAEKLEKREEEKTLLSNGVEKCGSYNELSMDLHHNFLAAAGSPRKFSVDGAMFGLRRTSKIDHPRKTNTEQSENHINFLSNAKTLSTSVPFLYNVNLNDGLGSHDPKQLSKSMNNIRI
ncbi:Major facilitator superfamily domain-containing protein 6-A [Armadillidium vulgare]|nr:Major facilitator superfamily domain-containing protein 6-A [Armadillidium vulgare]